MDPRSCPGHIFSELAVSPSHCLLAFPRPVIYDLTVTHILTYIVPIGEKNGLHKCHEPEHVVCKIPVKILCPEIMPSWCLLLALKIKKAHEGFLVGIYPVPGEVIKWDRSALLKL